MKRSLFTFLVGITALTVWAFAESANTHGEVSVSGKKVLLRHAVAFEDEEKLTILISENPLPSDLQHNDQARLQAGLEGKWQGLELRVYKDKSVTPDLDVFHQLLKGNAWIGGPDFEITNRTEDLVEGRVFMEAPGEFFGKSFHYNATFKAPIQH